MLKTADPHVFIAGRGAGWVVYRNVTDGRRWRVEGVCDRRGDCLVGAVIEGYGLIATHRDIKKAQRTLGRERIDSELDVPVGPGFKGCCPFEIVEL